MFARSTSASPLGFDRYEIAYYLDSDSSHTAGKLYLNEVNTSFGDSLAASSASSLPVTLGDIYQLTVTGSDTGSAIAFTATLLDITTSSSISVSKTDAANLLTGSNFGYFNFIRAIDGSTTSLNADFDNFSMLAVPEPGAAMLLFVALVVHCSVSARSYRC